LEKKINKKKSAKKSQNSGFSPNVISGTLFLIKKHGTPNAICACTKNPLYTNVIGTWQKHLQRA